MREKGEKNHCLDFWWGNGGPDNEVEHQELEGKV